MFFFERYFHTIIKYDLINTFFYQDLIKIPKLEKIILNFGYKNPNFRYIISSLLALEFISLKKGKITKSKDLNVFLKIKKGNPVGCKIILNKKSMYFFYLKLIIFILSKAKQSQKSRLHWRLKLNKSLSFQLKNPLLFAELENHFQFFKNISQLDVTLITDSKCQKELIFLFKSIKFFL